jgi:hypothetical protein
MGAVGASGKHEPHPFESLLGLLANHTRISLSHLNRGIKAEVR